MLKLMVIGNLGKDATTNNVNGNTVINFSVAHTEKYKDKQGNQQQKTTWVECSWWSDRLAIVPYLKKGTMVYLEGTPEVRSFAKQDGTTGASLVLRVMNCQLLGGGSNTNTQANENTQAAQQSTEGFKQSNADEDLPF